MPEDTSDSQPFSIFSIEMRFYCPSTRSGRLVRLGSVAPFSEELLDAPVVRNLCSAWPMLAPRGLSASVPYALSIFRPLQLKTLERIVRQKGVDDFETGLMHWVIVLQVLELQCGLKSRNDRGLVSRCLWTAQASSVTAKEGFRLQLAWPACRC